jgi:phosphoribosyl 1,2-cyclic phosphate phosphodiesterase
MLSEGGRNVVIDTGPDFRQQMLVNEVSTLDAVVFTHEHKDHLAGLDDIRAFNFSQRHKMDVFATSRVQEALRREFHYVFADVRYPGVPEIALHEMTLEPFEAGGFEFIPLEVMHHKLPVMAFRIGDFAYVTDANYIPPESYAQLRGVEVLVINALRKQRHMSHFNLEEALEIINDLKPKQAWLTHISHMMGRHADVEKELPGHVRIAYDGLEI